MVNFPNSAATVVSARTARKRRIAGIFQHYYPEGGWGYVVLLCAFLSQVLAQGLQLGMLVLMPYATRRFHASPAEAGKTNLNYFKNSEKSLSLTCSRFLLADADFTEDGLHFSLR